MFKKVLFAIAPMMLLACSVQADDDLLTAIAKMDSNNVAQVDASTDKLGQADVDALLGDDEENSKDAIAACFRRFGGHGRSYGSYGHFNYGFRSYSNWYSPCYTSYPTYNHCYTPTYTCYTPSYSCYTPCYTSYWGCY